MKKTIPYLFALLLLGVTRPLAADSAATVTEAVNKVDHGSAQSAVSTPAPTGTKLHDGEYLKTGASSRAELLLSNQSITRLGANTIFNYSAANNEIDLQAGTMLFSKPKDGKELNIKTAAVTAAITGTTGFVQKTDKGFIFGLIEGSSTVTIDGVDYTIHAGEILKFTPGQPPQIFAFNVPQMVHTSSLFKKFHHDLPNQKYIDAEIAEYNDLVDRGFIKPPTDPFNIYNFDNNGPTPPFLDHDSPGNALNTRNTPPPMDQATPTPPPRCCPPPPCCGYGGSR